MEATLKKPDCHSDTKSTFNSLIRGFFSSLIPNNTFGTGLEALKTNIIYMVASGNTEEVYCLLKDLNQIRDMPDQELKTYIEENGLSLEELVQVDLPDNINIMDDVSIFRYLISRMITEIDTASAI